MVISGKYFRNPSETDQKDSLWIGSFKTQFCQLANSLWNTRSRDPLLVLVSRTFLTVLAAWMKSRKSACRGLELNCQRHTPVAQLWLHGSDSHHLPQPGHCLCQSPNRAGVHRNRADTSFLTSPEDVKGPFLFKQKLKPTPHGYIKVENVTADPRSTPNSLPDPRCTPGTSTCRQAAARAGCWHQGKPCHLLLLPARGETALALVHHRASIQTPCCWKK